MACQSCRTFSAYWGIFGKGAVPGSLPKFLKHPLARFGLRPCCSLIDIPLEGWPPRRFNWLFGLRLLFRGLLVMDSQKLLDEGFAGGKVGFDLLATLGSGLLDLLQADRRSSQLLTDRTTEKAILVEHPDDGQ